ncbi:TIP41-like family-domain-containing protein [Pseudomassariella vexata]|uniref:TIP41-like family-domain-containing protein n=1 Tax=Pseudomassariella vexata TaxID=1141098 RepID=A0A1Y2EH67_9PEZI|nr:TIP41-like family-domain-containing protein [Pseudomassariella vexata]ORY70135.1 TIP41-like family-domain-containing protein [Pseudomassariella vexata]
MGPPTGHITSPNEPYPSKTQLSAATTTHTQGNFTISSRKLPISKAGPIEAMEKSLGIPIPEMIFGDNVVTVTHNPTGWSISFNAYDALDAVDKTDKNMLQVAHARSWSSSREEQTAGIKEVVKRFDWSYSTEYRGTVVTAPALNQNDGREEKKTTSTTAKMFGKTDRPIPVELLKRKDPMLFFDDVMLYESELDDNGISLCSVKLRVHEKRMLLLCRLFMRLDNVLLRIRDTRIYVDFETDEVTREFTAKEGKFEEVKKILQLSGLIPDMITITMRDPNKVADLLPVVDQNLEGVSLAS